MKHFYGVTISHIKMSKNNNCLATVNIITGCRFLWNLKNPVKRIAKKLLSIALLIMKERVWLITKKAYALLVKETLSP